MTDMIRLLVLAMLASGPSQIAHAEPPVALPAEPSGPQADEASPDVAPPTDPAAEDLGTGGIAIESPAIESLATAPEVTASAPAPEAVTINPLSRMALGDLQAFKGRPLFVPSRRSSNLPAPALMSNDAPALSETPAPDLRLIGIVTGVDKAVAVLGAPSGGPPISVRVGDTVETWQVYLIAPDRVVLRQGEREQAYRIFASAGAAIRTPSQMRKGEAAADPDPSTVPPELDR